jgi:hypothetical protein
MKSDIREAVREEEGLEDGATGPREGRSRRLCMWLALVALSQWDHQKMHCKHRFFFSNLFFHRVLFLYT